MMSDEAFGSFPGGPRKVTPVQMTAGSDTPSGRPAWVTERAPIGEADGATWTPAGTPVDPTTIERGPIGSYSAAEDASTDDPRIAALTPDPDADGVTVPDGTEADGSGYVPNVAPADQTEEDHAKSAAADEPGNVVQADPTPVDADPSQPPKASSSTDENDGGEAGAKL